MLRPILTNIAKSVLNSVFGSTRWAYNFDGVDDRGHLAFRAINPESDIDIEFKTGLTLPAPGASWTIVSQNITTTSANREFGLYTNNSNALQLLIGGLFSGNMGEPLEANRTYRVTLIGTTLTYFKDGSPVLVTSFTRGSSREPTATTGISARNTAVSSYGSYYSGMFYDLKINGTKWPINDRNLLIQLPEPSGLGGELITQDVLENPLIKGTQWTYLGSGRWQYIGDGSFNALQFISAANIPNMGLMDFNVESISGGIIRCTATSTGVYGDRTVSTIGPKRLFYTTKPSDWQFVRNGASDIVSCVIKDISFKPLIVPEGSNLWGARNLAAANASTVSTVTSGSSWTVTRTGSNAVADAGRSSDITDLVVGDLYSITFDTSSPVTISLYDGTFALKESTLGNTFIFTAQAVNKIYVAPTTQNLAVTVSNPVLSKVFSICNPLTLGNTTSDRWVEVTE